MTRTELETAINNCNSVDDILKIEALYYDEYYSFGFYDKAIIEIVIAREKARICASK